MSTKKFNFDSISHNIELKNILFNNLKISDNFGYLNEDEKLEMDLNYNTHKDILSSYFNINFNSNILNCKNINFLFKNIKSLKFCYNEIFSEYLENLCDVVKVNLDNSLVLKNIYGDNLNFKCNNLDDSLEIENIKSNLEIFNLDYYQINYKNNKDLKLLLLDKDMKINFKVKIVIKEKNIFQIKLLLNQIMINYKNENIPFCNMDLEYEDFKILSESKYIINKKIDFEKDINEEYSDEEIENNSELDLKENDNDNFDENDDLYLKWKISYLTNEDSWSDSLSDNENLIMEEEEEGEEGEEGQQEEEEQEEEVPITKKKPRLWH